jgi:hypothetical protein
VLDPAVGLAKAVVVDHQPSLVAEPVGVGEDVFVD